LIFSRQESCGPSSLSNQELFKAAPQGLPAWFSVVFEVAAKGRNGKKRIAKTGVQRQEVAPLQDAKHVDLGGSQ